MSNLFNLDGPVLQFINKIVYSVYLNILWFICCIPVVTIGASTTALFYVTLKMSKNEEGNLTKAFFHSFRENLKQATIIWLILLFLGIVLGIVIGKILHGFVITTCEVDMVMFGHTVKFASYCYSSLLTVLFAAAVGVIMHFKLRRIDMIESLKSIE